MSDSPGVIRLARTRSLGGLQNCRRCPRLVAHMRAVRSTYPDYHCAPVVAEGKRDDRLLIVGLAPGLHGANRSGRPFVGDASGRFLYECLHAAGFATSPTPAEGKPAGATITNAVKCLPPGNQVVADEVRNCAGYLASEIRVLWTAGCRKNRVILCLGHVAHRATAAALGIAALPFGHAAQTEVAPKLWLLDSYHPSRQNVNTGRLTHDMMMTVLRRVHTLLGD